MSLLHNLPQSAVCYVLRPGCQLVPTIFSYLLKQSKLYPILSRCFGCLLRSYIKTCQIFRYTVLEAQFKLDNLIT